MQTITTKYLQPTNFLGARIKATTSNGISKTIPYPHELSNEESHIEAVKKLNERLNWSGKMVFSPTDSGYIFSFVKDDNMITL